MATMLFITEAIPLPTVPLLIIVGQVVLLKVDPTKVAQSLMTDSVLFIMGSLMLAVAIVRQRLDKRIAWWIVRMTGTNIYCDQLRHHRGVRRDRRLHRRAYGGGHDAARGRHPHHAHLQ